MSRWPRPAAWLAGAEMFKPPRKEIEMRRLALTRQLVTVITIASLATLLNLALASAQGTEEGTANFYSDKFQGKKLASGEQYDKNKLTAAHKTLAFGTKVKVTNLDNGKSAVVTINDRMKKSNKAVIDVSRKAADELGFVKSGKAKVKLETEK